MNDQVYVLKYGKKWREEKRKWELIKMAENISFFFTVISLAASVFIILNNTILNIHNTILDVLPPFSLASLGWVIVIASAFLAPSILLERKYNKEELWKVENLVELRDLGQLKFKDEDWKDHVIIFEKDETWAINKKTKKAKVVNFNEEAKDR
jgi:hypothetical protein